MHVVFSSMSFVGTLSQQCDIWFHQQPRVLRYRLILCDSRSAAMITTDYDAHQFPLQA